MKVHYPKLYNMAHLLALNFLLLPKDLTIIFIDLIFNPISNEIQMSSIKQFNSFHMLICMEP